MTIAVHGIRVRPALLRLMRAPGLHARRAVSLGGRIIGTDGRLRGPDRTTLVVPVARRYDFVLPAASAGLLSGGSRVDGRLERQDEAGSRGAVGHA
jgi:hypothetical protein